MIPIQSAEAFVSTEAKPIPAASTYFIAIGAFDGKKRYFVNSRRPQRRQVRRLTLSPEIVPARILLKPKASSIVPRQGARRAVRTKSGDSSLATDYG